MTCITAYGDDALLLTLPNARKDEASLHIQSIAQRLRRRKLFTEIVPAYDSLLVQFDPTALNIERAQTIIETVVQTDLNSARDQGPAAHRAPIPVPVCYEAEHAPDMDAACSALCLTRAQIIALHTGRPYSVCMLGFLPGFTFLSAIDPALELARHTRPRVHVPAGSVGIAGWQTGIYALDSPGGWQILGRTPLALFDPASSTPFRFDAGDRLRFTAISAAEFKRLSVERL